MKAPTHKFNVEKLAALDRKLLDQVRANALRLKADDLILLCDQEIERRGSTKISGPKVASPKRDVTDVVAGYHFVCGNDRGVIVVNERRFWTGSWVVAEMNARNSLKYGAYLALHESKAEPSYRQGQIVDYRLSPRDMVAKSEDGIEFLIDSTDIAYSWIGSGAGEKGYKWMRLVASKVKASGESELGK